MDSRLDNATVDYLLEDTVVAQAKKDIVTAIGAFLLAC